jgi:8-oxo-dGTP pyrophosphatase MutT (NUDIX family)
MTKSLAVTIGNPIGNLYRKNHVLILIQLKNGNFLLGKKQGFYPDHMARFVGGGVKNDEDSVSAAKREIAEELKIEVDKNHLIHLAKIITNAMTAEGDMSMTTNVYGLILDTELKLTASDDLTGLIELTTCQFEDLIRDMYSLTGTLTTDTFSFDWHDWGKIYGPIHEMSLKVFLMSPLSHVHVS